MAEELSPQADKEGPRSPYERRWDALAEAGFCPYAIRAKLGDDPGDEAPELAIPTPAHRHSPHTDTQGHPTSTSYEDTMPAGPPKPLTEAQLERLHRHVGEIRRLLLERRNNKVGDS